MRQFVPSDTWVEIDHFPFAKEEVYQNSGETSTVWFDRHGNLVLQKLRPKYTNHRPIWQVRGVEQ